MKSYYGNENLTNHPCKLMHIKNEQSFDCTIMSTILTFFSQPYLVDAPDLIYFKHFSLLFDLSGKTGGKYYKKINCA